MNKQKTLKVGQKATLKKVFTQKDVTEYADLTGDTNPIFIDESYIRKTSLKKAVVPPDLLLAMISNLLGTKLPGRGTNWMKQTLKFPSPAYLGEEITAIVEISRIRPAKQLVNLSTICTNPDGQIVCEGEALVLIKELEQT